MTSLQNVPSHFSELVDQETPEIRAALIPDSAVDRRATTWMAAALAVLVLGATPPESLKHWQVMGFQFEGWSWTVVSIALFLVSVHCAVRSYWASLALEERARARLLRPVRRVQTGHAQLVATLGAERRALLQSSSELHDHFRGARQLSHELDAVDEEMRLVHLELATTPGYEPRSLQKRYLEVRRQHRAILAKHRAALNAFHSSGSDSAAGATNTRLASIVEQSNALSEIEDDWSSALRTTLRRQKVQAATERLVPLALHLVAASLLGWRWYFG